MSGHLVHLCRCPVSGKVRFRDKREAVGALHHAVAVRRRAEADGLAYRRREQRAYPCDSCHGWHLTSQTAWGIGAASAPVIETALVTVAVSRA